MPELEKVTPIAPSQVLTPDLSRNKLMNPRRSTIRSPSNQTLGLGTSPPSSLTRRQSMAVSRTNVALSIFGAAELATPKQEPSAHPRYTKPLMIGPGHKTNHGKSTIEDARATKRDHSQPDLYEQFATVSFRNEAEKDQYKTQKLFEDQPTFWTILWYDISGWVIPGIIGFLTAASGSLIEVCLEVISDWRFGFCQGKIFSSRIECCGGRSLTNGQNNSCHFQDPLTGNLTVWKPWHSYDFASGEVRTEQHLIGYSCYVAFGLVMCTLSATIVYFVAPTARGSGIPEVKTILGGFVMKDVLSGRTLVVKIICLMFAVASGMSLGKEGPLVHVACCWATVCAVVHDRYMENEGKRRELLSAAAAAGVSVAFGSPLGGVLFSLEEVSTFFPQKTMYKAFFSAVVAALSLQWFDPTGTGKMTMFEVKYDKPLDKIEYLPFALLGVIGGFVGSAFVALNVRVSAFRLTKRYKDRVHIIVEVFMIGLITFVTSYPFVFLRPLSSEVIHKLFMACDSTLENSDALCKDGKPLMTSEMFVALIVASVIKLGQTIITFGTGVPAGLFVPSLFVGATIGRIMGTLLIMFNQNVFQFAPDGYEIQPGVYAMVGAAAVLGGVCRVTISLVVIMFELTGALQYVVPFMLAVMIAKWVGDFFTAGIYDCYIVLKGYPYLHEPEEITYSARACDVMFDELEVIHVQKQTLGDLLQMTQDCPFHGFPLVRSETDFILLGYLICDELRDFLNSKLKETFVNLSTPVYFSMHSPKFYLDSVSANNGIDLSDLVDDTVMRLVPETPMSQVHNVFRQLGLRMIMVVRHGRLQGMITKKSFVSHLHEGTVGNIKHDPSHYAAKAPVEVHEEAPRGIGSNYGPSRKFSINEILPETDLSQFAQPLLEGVNTVSDVGLKRGSSARASNQALRPSRTFDATSIHKNCRPTVI